MYKKGQLEFDEGMYGNSTGAYLPHSCDEWEIGKKQEIEWLIEDLQEILKKYFPG